MMRDAVVSQDEMMKDTVVSQDKVMMMKDGASGLRNHVSGSGGDAGPRKRWRRRFSVLGNNAGIPELPIGAPDVQEARPEPSAPASRTQLPGVDVLRRRIPIRERAACVDGRNALDYVCFSTMHAVRLGCLRLGRVVWPRMGDGAGDATDASDVVLARRRVAGEWIHDEAARVVWGMLRQASARATDESAHSVRGQRKVRRRRAEVDQAQQRLWTALAALDWPGVLRAASDGAAMEAQGPPGLRSEERRVGKECPM
jgi:hypothetical protein